MTPEQATILLERYRSHTASEQEVQLVETWYGKLEATGELQWGEGERAAMQARIYVVVNESRELHSLTADLKPGVSPLPESPYSEDKDFSIAPSVHRARFLKTVWFRYAAVLLLIVGTATFLYRISSPQNGIALKQPAVKAPDIQPGGNKAMLTLSDGRTIVLDSADNGTLAKQGNTTILKLKAGSLAYNAGNEDGGVLYNTVSTPNGGQYQIVLPDGSKVWLNAASSIRFPTYFAKERKVFIAGEVYMEVAPDKEKPFMVIAEKVEVQVLGTSFNINAYADESVSKTSLIEGSIKMIKGSYEEILKPGQQAIVTDRILLERHAKIREAIAWKNGYFYLQDKKLDEVLREISRWYDIKIVYEKNIHVVEFWGKIERNLKLSDVILFLQRTGLRCELKERTLTILK